MLCYKKVLLSVLLTLHFNLLFGQCYEMEIGVAYQSDMSASDIAAFDLQSVIDEANMIFANSSMSAKPVLSLTTVVEGQSNFILGGPCFPDGLLATWNSDPFTIDPDIALYITNSSFGGIPSLATDYGCAWAGGVSVDTFHFYAACTDNGNGTLLVNQQNVLDNARLLVRLIGKHFAASTRPGIEGIFAHEEVDMTSDIDSENAETISIILPNVVCLEEITCPATSPPCDDNIVMIQGSQQLQNDTIHAAQFIKTIGDINIPALADIKLYAGDSILFESEFTVVQTGILEADIRDCQ